MITPVNGHLLIEPIKQEAFISSQKETYQEIGTIIAMDDSDSFLKSLEFPIGPGSKVYFDSWLAAKFPSEIEGEYYWLVQWQHVRAVEYVEPKISE